MSVKGILTILKQLTAMRTFIYDYLQNPSQAIADARQRAYYKFFDREPSEERIYEELGSPEFRLYEEMIFSEDIEPQSHDFAVA